MSKHDLRARPVFHHTRDAIEAHLTVVMASLARARSLVGLKGYVTNIPARLMDASEVISSYHELWHARSVLCG